MPSTVRVDVDSTAAIRRYRLSCSHGTSAAATLLDRPAASDDVVVDILFARHQTAHGCTCHWPVATVRRSLADPREVPA